MKAGWALAVALAVTAGSAAAQVGGATLTGTQSVQLAQSALAVLGYDPGPVDGLMGPATRAAIDAYVEAAGLEMGWDGQVIDQGQAMSLNVAAMAALTEMLGADADGNYLDLAVVPYDQTEDLLAGRVAFLSEESSGVCSDRPDEVLRIDGLMVFEPGRDAAVVTVDDGALKPLPRTGTWHPEAEPWRLVVISDQLIALQQEGDNYVYARCLP